MFQFIWVKHPHSTNTCDILNSARKRQGSQGLVILRDRWSIRLPPSKPVDCLKCRVSVMACCYTRITHGTKRWSALLKNLNFVFKIPKCEFLWHVIVNVLGVRYFEKRNWYYTLDVRQILQYIKVVMSSANYYVPSVVTLRIPEFCTQILCVFLSFSLFTGTFL